MVDFKMLETFVWVANLRSFRGAAEKLNTTQPAISMRIAQLEEDLGVRLLERDRRLVSPTEKGQLLLGYADRLIRLRAETVEGGADRKTMRGLRRPAGSAPRPSRQRSSRMSCRRSGSARSRPRWPFPTSTSSSAGRRRRTASPRRRSPRSRSAWLKTRTLERAADKQKLSRSIPNGDW